MDCPGHTLMVSGSITGCGVAGALILIVSVAEQPFSVTVTVRLPDVKPGGNVPLKDVPFPEGKLTPSFRNQLIEADTGYPETE
jgi:hypothetical protein